MSSSPRPRLVRLGAWFRRYLFAGFLALFPLVVTVWAGSKFLGFLDGIIGKYLVRYYPELARLPGLGILCLLAVLLISGRLFRSYVGRKAFAVYDSVLTRLPLARTIYVSVKRILEVVSPEEGKPPTFRGVALIEFPRPGSHVLVFVTQEQSGMFDPDGCPLVGVCYPTTPNPTTGFLLFVRASDLLPCDLTIEEATTMIMSMGIVTPERVRALASTPVGIARETPAAAVPRR